MATPSGNLSPGVDEVAFSEFACNVMPSWSNFASLRSAATGFTVFIGGASTADISGDFDLFLSVTETMLLMVVVVVVTAGTTGGTCRLLLIASVASFSLDFECER